MKLRKYRKEDASVICSWIKDEKSLYQWTADRIGKFPVNGDDLNTYYESVLNDKFIPLSACGENGCLEGHLFIRYPDEADHSTVRFGFVIIDPELRGQGNGKKMLQLAVRYAENELHAGKITLGVFASNDNAKYCYEAAGFRSYGKTSSYRIAGSEWECIEMEMKIS